MNDPKRSAHQQASARQRAQLIMQVRSGLLSVRAAVRQLRVSRKTYYKWERRALAAMVEALGNREAGHTARTKMAEMGMPDEVMDAQMGHASPAIGKRYSRIRREAMKRAAAALGPAEAVRQILINTPEADKNATIQ